jgi:preprotein translocase subunit SecG
LILYILYTIFFVSCILLVAAVLLQPGKTDAGALFTSNISSSAFGPRGTATVLSKLTIAAATIFMLSALLISMPAVTGSRSVLQNNPEVPAESQTGNTVTVPVGNSAVPIEANVAPGTAPANTSDANAAAANSTGANQAEPAANK